MNYYEYFDKPASGECMEYEIVLANRQERDEKDFEFGFCSGESPVVSFYVKNSKLYDHEKNFVYHFGDEEFEIFGSIFSSYHNYSIDRVPVNIGATKEIQPDGKNYIDGIYYNNTGISLSIKAYGETRVVSDLYNYSSDS